MASDEAVQKLALAVQSLVTKLEMIGIHQGEKNESLDRRLLSLEGTVRLNNGKSHATRIALIEKAIASHEAALSQSAQRARSFWDGVGAAIVIRAVFVFLGLAGLGAGYALMQMVAAG